MLLCLFIGISLAGCSSEMMYKVTDSADGPGSADTRVPRRIVINENHTPDVEPDNTGMSLMITGHTARALNFVISNNTGYNIRYGNGYELTGSQ
jgi:hypothetical protein